MQATCTVSRGSARGGSVLWRSATTSRTVTILRSSYANKSHNFQNSQLHHSAPQTHKPTSNNPYSRSQIHSPAGLRPIGLPTPLTAAARATRMASTAPTETPEWTAQRVRETFIKYFKDRGHTFGKSTRSIPINNY